MSWARDEWKEGLPAHALRKVSEYEESFERNRKELQQRQFQLDSLNAALQKQKILNEEQKNIGNQYKRELQTASEKCDEYEKTYEKVMADMHIKDSRIDCLDGLLLKEKQALECEIGKCNRLKVDLETNMAKYNNLLSEHNKLQEEVQVQYRQTNSYEDCGKKVSCPTCSNSKPGKEVFPGCTETPSQVKQQGVNVEAIPIKIRASSSTSSEEMVPTFQTPSQEGKIRELQRTLETVRKEKGIIGEKWEKSVQELDICQSKLVSMENKQKQLVQHIECSRHNVEAGRRHQEERMKEKEREYRDEIASQTKALIQLEQELKDVKIKLDQEQKCSSLRLKDSEMTTKKLQGEIEMAHEAMKRLEFEKSEKNSLVESYEKTINELRKELTVVKQSKDFVAKSLEENVNTIQSLNQELERQGSELEEKKAMIAKLEQSKELLITEERQKNLELLRSRENDCENAVAKLNELERCLDESNISNTEKESSLNKRVGELASQLEKNAPLLKQKEQEILTLKASLELKRKEIEKMAELLEETSNSEQLQKMSEEKELLEGQLESTRKLCESLKQKLKESDVEISQIDARRQVLQMDSEDKDRLIATLGQQKATLEFGFQENLRKMTQLNENLRSINEQVESLKNENEVLKSGMNERKSNEKQLRDELSQTKTALENAIAGKSTLADELSRTNEERNKKYEEYEKRTAELEKLVEDLRCVRDISEQSAVGELKEKLEKTRKLLDEKNCELSNMTPRYKSLEEKFNLTMVKLEKVTTESKCMKVNMTTLAADKSNLLTDFKALELERDGLVKMMSEHETVISEKNRLINSLRISNEEILEKRNAEFRSVEFEVKKLSDECLDKTHQLLQENEKVDELCKERDRLRESVERLRAELVVKDNEEQRCADQRQELERLNLEYKTTAEKLEDELSATLEMAEKERTTFAEKFREVKEELLQSKENVQKSKNGFHEAKARLENLESEKEYLNVEIDKLKSEKEFASQEVEKARSCCKEFSEKLAAQEKILNEYRFTAEQLECELATTKELYESMQIRNSESLTKLNDELNTEKENSNTAKKDLEGKLAHVLSLKAEKECLHLEIENMKSEKQAVSDQYKNTLMENKIFVQKLAASEQQNTVYEKEVERLQQQVKDINRKVESTQTKFNESMGNLRNELIEEKEKLELTKIDLKEKETALETLKSEKKSLEFEFENIKSQKQTILEKYERSLKEGTISKEKITASEEETSKYKIAIEKIEQKLSEMKETSVSTQTKLTEDLTTVKNELREEKRKLETAREDLKEKKLAIQTIKTEKELLEFQIENMKSENKVISEKFERFSNETNMSKQKLAARERTMNDLKIMVEQLQQELTGAQNMVESTEIMLGGEIENLRNDLAQEKERLEKVRNELQKKEATIQLKNDEKESLQFEVENLKSEKQADLKKLEKTLKEYRISQEMLAASKNQIDDYKLTLEQLQREETVAKDMIKAGQTKFNEDTNNLRKELAIEKEKVEETTKTLQEKESVIFSIKSRNEALEFEIEQLKSENEKVVEKLENMKQQCNAYVDRLAESDKLAGDYETQNSAIKDLKKQLNEKDHELNQIKAQHDDVKITKFKEISDLKEMLGSKNSLLSERVYELDQLKILVETQSERLREAEEESKRQEEKRERTTTQLKQEIDTIRKYGDQKSKELERSMELVKSLQCELEKKIIAASLAERESEKEREQLLERIKKAAKDLKEIESILFQKEETIFILKKQLEDSTVRTDQEHYQAMNAVKEENKILSEKIHQYKFEIEQLKVEVKSSRQDLESEIREKNARILLLESDLDKVEAERQKLECTNQKNMAKVRDLEGDLVRESEKVGSSCKRIDELLSNSRQERDAMLNAERDFGKVRGELEGEIKILRQQLEKQKDSLEDYRLSKQKLEDVQTSYNKTKAALQKSEETVVSLQDSLKEITLERDRQCHESRETSGTYEVLLNSANEEKTRLEKAITKYKHTIQEIQGKLDDQICKAEDNKQFLKEKDDELFMMSKELESKICEVERVRKDYEACKEVEVELRHHLGVVTRELEDWKCEENRSGDLKKANEKIKELEEALQAKSSRLDEEREEIVAKTKEFVLQREKEHEEKTVNLEGELAKKEQMFMRKCEELLQLKHQLQTEQKSKENLLKHVEEREKELELEKETMEKGPVTPRRFRAMETDLAEERELTKRLQEKCVVLEEVIEKEQTNRVILQKKVKHFQNELPNLEEKEAKISALESQVGTLSQQFGAIKADFEAEKMNNALLEKEVEQLKQKGLNLEKLLQNEMQTNEMLHKDNEQLKQKNNDFDSKQCEPVSILHEQPDSMKVFELECCVDGLKREIAEQQEKIADGKGALKQALESKDVLERSLNVKVKENEELQKLFKTKLKASLEEKIAKLKEQLAKTENDKLETPGLKMEIKSLKNTGAAQQALVNQLEDKKNQLELLLHQKTKSLTKSEETKKELEEELVKVKQFASKATSTIDELNAKLQQAKCSLKNSSDNLEKEKRKTEFMEALKEEVLKVEEKCASWRGRCTDYENKLSEEQLGFKREKMLLEEKISTVTNCYNETKGKLEHLEMENKPMVERLLQLEGEMIMMPRIEDLQKELERLSKELNNEKENAVKYEKLSREYLSKLNEFTSTNSCSCVDKLKEISKDQQICRKETAHLPPNVGALRDKRNQDGQTILTPREEQKVKDKLSCKTLTATPILEEERQVFLSPVTRSLSNLGFSSPVQEKVDSKNPSRLMKPAVKSNIQKPKVTVSANPPGEKKRKDKDAIQSKAKRVKVDSTNGDLLKIRSPFVLNRNREIQTRSRMSSSQSRLAQPSVRTLQQPKGRSRIPKRPMASGRNTTGEKGSSQLPTSHPSSDECKMQ